MIKRFDTYVLTDRGFIATKGDLVFHCYQYGVVRNSFEVALYTNKQKHKRARAWAGSGDIRWCREAAVRMIDRYA